MKVSNIFQKEECNTSGLLLWTTFIAYVALISFFGSRHEHWLDEWHVWYMCKDNSLLGLIIATATDGHFILWQLLNYPFVKMGFGFGCLEVLSCLLCALGAFFFLFKAPFSFPSKFLVLMSFPMLYSFPVLTRCYALIPLIIFSIGYLYRKLPRHKYLYCFCIGMLSLTHFYMEGMVGILFLLYCYDFLYLPFKKKQPWKKNIGPITVTAIMIIMALLHIRWASHIAAKNHNYRVDSSVELLDRLFDAYAIQPSYALSIPGTTTTPNLDLVITILVWIALIVALYKICSNSPTGKRMAIIGGVSIFFMVVFGTSIYFMILQRIYLPFFVIIALLWANYKPNQKKYHTYALISLSVMSSFNHYREIKEDVDKLYCNAEKVSDYIHDNIPQDAIIAEGARYGFIFELLKNDYNSFVLTESKDTLLTDQMLDSFAESHSCNQFYPISMCPYEYQGEKYSLDCIYDGFQDDVIFYRFFAYRIQKKTESSSICE